LLAFVLLLLVQAGVTRAEAELPRAPYELGYATRAAAITTGADGAVWVAAEEEFNGIAVIARVTTKGEVTEFPLPKEPHTRVGTIAAGSDGNIWFGEKGAIGRIDMAGQLTSFALPAGTGAPTALTAGPDGNVWFVASAPSKIGRITPSGEVKEFALPPGREPDGITAGPDGNLWFTEPGTSAIGRITPAGRITEFPVPGGPAKKLASIVAGPDGNLWFGEFGATRIGRITPAGLVTQFKVPTEGGTDQLVAGPDGRIYFISGDQVGAIGTDGEVAWPSCINDYCDPGPEAMTLGPDHRLWVSTGTVTCLGLCGGGAALGLAAEPGDVRPYVLPPLRLGIGPRPTRIEGNRTALLLACGQSAPCKGRLQLGHPVYYGGKSHFRVFGQSTYELGRGESKRVSVVLSPRFFAELRHNHTIHLIALAIEKGQPLTRRGIWLKH
jgi:streptogramin lyase